MKKPAIKALESLAIAEAQKKYPDLPLSHFVATRKYSDNGANKLTCCIIDWLHLNGHQAERISVTGRYVDNSKNYTDCIGRVRRVGSGKYIPSSMQKGSADISSIIKTANGAKCVKIEVKYSKGDRQSTYQKEYQKQVEAAGGVYYIAKDFESFMNFYNDLVKK